MATRSKYGTGRLDRTAFVRPTAHRGLHNAKLGVVENTAPAFMAAIANGYGIELDLRPAKDGTPIVFHDLDLARLVDASGRISDHTPKDLAKLKYKTSQTATYPITFGELLELVDGRVPILAEIKSEWAAPDQKFLAAIAALAKPYKGPLALMSFDPAMISGIKPLAPKIPRGIISGIYHGDDWWLDQLDAERAYRLSHLIESAPAAPDFFAYHVKDLPTPVTRFLREGLRMPLFTWTVRTAADLETAHSFADAPIFEGLMPGPAPMPADQNGQTLPKRRFLTLRTRIRQSTWTSIPLK